MQPSICACSMVGNLGQPEGLKGHKTLVECGNVAEQLSTLS